MKTQEDSDCHSSDGLLKATVPFGIDHYSIKNNLLCIAAKSLPNTQQNKSGVLVIDGFITSRNTYLSLSKCQIKTALEKCKINKVVEKIYVNQFGVPVIIHRIIGGDVFKFAKTVGLSPFSPSKTKEVEYMLGCCAFTYIGENVIYDESNSRF